MKTFSGEKLIEERKGQRKASFTLVELLVVMGLLSLIAFLVYPAYLGTSRSYSLTDVKTNLQQNARLGMKKMVIYLEAGMVVDIKNEPDDDNNPMSVDGDGVDWIPNDGLDQSDAYQETNPDFGPSFIIFYFPDLSNPTQPGDEIALYAGLPDAPRIPVNPAQVSEEERPLLYMRKYDIGVNPPQWQDPERLIRFIASEEDPSLPQMKITQLNFILGGDNQDKVLVTLELAQEDSTGEWRTYKLVSAVKMEAR